MVKHF